MKTKFEKWFLFLAVLICVYGCAIGNQEPYDPFIDLEPGSAKIQIGDRMFESKAEYRDYRLFLYDINRPVSGIIHDQGTIIIRFREVDLDNKIYTVTSSGEIISADHRPPGGHWAATSGSVSIHKIGVGHIEGKFEFTMRTIGSVFPVSRKYKGGFNAMIVEDE